MEIHQMHKMTQEQLKKIYELKRTKQRFEAVGLLTEEVKQWINNKIEEVKNE